MEIMTNRDLLELAAIARTKQLMGECPDCLECSDCGFVVRSRYKAGQGWTANKVACPECGE